MQMWKKVGAALGSAVMIGATLAGAALAQTTSMDLGDYDDLVISDGAVSGLFVVGANAAAADVVTAINMAAWVGNQDVAGSGSGTGEVTLTPLTASVAGVKRHYEINQTGTGTGANGKVYELSSNSNDTIGPAGFASGDGVIDFLYSYKEKGPLFINSSESNWHERVLVDNSKLDLRLDTQASSAGDDFDDVVLHLSSNSIEYRLTFDNPVLDSDIKSKNLWFMGKEYTVISATADDNMKLGGTDAKVILTTSNPDLTIGGIDVSLGGIFSVGTSNTFKAKVTVTNGGTTESKFITSATTEVVAGIEVFVEDAVVTTSGTNEGEAKLIVGADILKLEDGNFLKLGDGTETSWQVDFDKATNTNTGVFYDITVTYTESHTSETSSNNAVLTPGDSIASPNGLFSVSYNGLFDKFGLAPDYVNVDVTTTTRDLDRVGGSQQVIRVQTPDGDFLEYQTSGGVTQLTNTLYVNVTERDSDNTQRIYYKDPASSTVAYSEAAANSAKVYLAPDNKFGIKYSNQSSGLTGVATGWLNLNESALNKLGTATPFTLEYNASGNGGNGHFESLEDAETGSAQYYAYYGAYAATPTANGFLGDDGTGQTVSARDYLTPWGSLADSVSQTLVSFQFPRQQLFGQVVVGSQATGKGIPVVLAAGEIGKVGGTTLEVSGSISSGKSVSLPSTLAKTDAEVTDSDKSGLTLVLVGGPAVNSLVAELQTKGKLEKTIGSVGGVEDVASTGAGVVELVADAFANGKYAVVVAGSDRAGTRAAGNVLANFDANEATLDGKTAYVV